MKIYDRQESTRERIDIDIRARKLTLSLVLAIFISLAKDTHATRATRLFNHFQIVLKPFQI